MTLYDLALICRSKNAGPFRMTIDLMFRTEVDYERALHAPNLTAARVAALYRVAPEDVAVKPFKRILTIKVVLPRSISSGSPGDVDVYGSQQHFPLGLLEV
ncbi:MAG: DUF4387 domain-containing protein [Kiritimatiellae bacterium]|jgi:hypothetical protein|nr:DUF4387 domain-containing protein [Kiritimatiellia bacterium]